MDLEAVYMLSTTPLCLLEINFSIKIHNYNEMDVVSVVCEFP